MKLTEYLKKAVEEQASDLFFVAGSRAKEKIEGNICDLGETMLLPSDTENLITEMYQIAGRKMDQFCLSGDDDFSFSITGLARFRVNVYRQRGSWAAVIRIVSFDIPDWQDLLIPQEVMNIADMKSGLVLITGTAGSGKSTTQACIVDRINATRSCHIVTLEDPIEFLHRHKKSIISQREISIDTDDYAKALRATLRQAPDVILMGEMRDGETIRTAITAAETGHLVLATLHTKGAVNSIDRMIDGFEMAQQGQIRIQLSNVLRTVVSQQLLPAKNEDLVSAFEVMQVNTAIRNLIRDNKNHQIDHVIASYGKDGMIPMDQSIQKLYREGIITKETALAYAVYPEQLERIL